MLVARMPAPAALERYGQCLDVIIDLCFFCTIYGCNRYILIWISRRLVRFDHVLTSRLSRHQQPPPCTWSSPQAALHSCARKPSKIASARFRQNVRRWQQQTHTHLHYVYFVLTSQFSRHPTTPTVHLEWPGSNITIVCEETVEDCPREGPTECPTMAAAYTREVPTERPTMTATITYSF